MDKKNKKKPMKKQAPEKGEQKPPETTEVQTEQEGNDYGGIPDRDLRKNLGCGG